MSLRIKASAKFIDFFYLSIALNLNSVVNISPVYIQYKQYLVTFTLCMGVFHRHLLWFKSVQVQSSCEALDVRHFRYNKRVLRIDRIMKKVKYITPSQGLCVSIMLSGWLIRLPVSCATLAASVLRERDICSIRWRCLNGFQKALSDMLSSAVAPANLLLP